MFSDMHDCPLNKDFHKDNCIYTTIEGGLTDGDATTFAKVSENLSNFPIGENESLSEWSLRYGEPLYKAIREYKPINKAKYDAKWKSIREDRGY